MSKTPKPKARKQPRREPQRVRMRATIPGRLPARDHLRIEEPGPKPNLSDPPTAEEIAWHTGADAYNHQLQGWAHAAVYGTDLFFQDLLRDYALMHLHAGDNIPLPIRAWIAYVLRKLDKLPRERTGGTFDRVGHSMFWSALAGICQESPPGELVTDMLRRAAGELHTSYEKVRAFYYSDTFRMPRQEFSRKRRAKK